MSKARCRDYIKVHARLSRPYERDACNLEENSTSFTVSFLAKNIKRDNPLFLGDFVTCIHSHILCFCVVIDVSIENTRVCSRQTRKIFDSKDERGLDREKTSLWL